MALSSQSLEILLDLIEIKSSALQIQDRDDARELNKLRKCRQELLSEINHSSDKRRKKIVRTTPFPDKLYRRSSSSKY